jgi:hypothetical protein
MVCKSSTRFWKSANTFFERIHSNCVKCGSWGEPRDSLLRLGQGTSQSASTALGLKSQRMEAPAKNSYL